MRCRASLQILVVAFLACGRSPSADHLATVRPLSGLGFGSLPPITDARYLEVSDGEHSTTFWVFRVGADHVCLTQGYPESPIACYGPWPAKSEGGAR